MIVTISIIAYNQSIISSAKYTVLGKSLNVSSLFLWNMSPVGAAPNDNLLYLYLPNWHANVVKYDDLSSSFKVWYPKFASIRERYCTWFIFGNLSLSIGPVYVPVFLMVDLALLDLELAWLSHFVLVPIQSCCTIQQSHLCLEVQWCLFTVGTQILLWMSIE